MHNTDNNPYARITVWITLGVIGVFSFWGGFARRWIADDGLIVLRTVRNLQAGNGPVFNAGERVEANTSTLWQYLVWGAGWLTRLDLVTVAIYLGLFLSVAAMVIGAWATATRLRSGALIAPAGALVYLALPPARDFFTSGLEWGLSIFYLAVLWALLVRWAGTPRAHAGRHAQPGFDSTPYVLAWWAGMSWLVRPEFALYGGLTGLLLLIAHRSWRARLGILAVAVLVPGCYQFFRMGYYGLLTPHTAVAKSASGSAWGHGFSYLADFFMPYMLWMPLVLLAIAAWQLYGKNLHPRGWRSQATVTYLLVGAAALHTLYVLRVGGDFMHGRMLLLPLFAVLLPVFVLPLRTAATTLVAALCALWALVIVLRAHPQDWAKYEQGISVVDERDFWTYATKREPGHPPRTVEDFDNMKLLGGFDKGIEDLCNGDALALPFLVNDNPQTFEWHGLARDPQRTDPATLYLINMGMSSANAPLEVRVLDPIGLATPLAARQPRIEDGRIGHDKNLASIWQVADSGADIEQLPPWFDKEGSRRAREALQSDDFQRLFATYRDPLTAQRFWENIRFSLGEGRTLTFSANPEDYLR
ncbi:flagellar motor control protein ZomB [Corynebacterium flavescens]|uniref:flagellar motor control protein ZomB n=1 Tax=Corynebacterium flavescens TaxID=28028 RepID=UPI003FD1EB75